MVSIVRWNLCYHAFADKEYANYLKDLTEKSPFVFSFVTLNVILGLAQLIQLSNREFPKMTSITNTQGVIWHPM